MREDLLGYLLGALEPEEMERISEALRTDPALRAELEQLERAIRPLDDANDIYEPPAGLIGRAMDMIPFADPAPIDSGSEDNVPLSDSPFVGSPTDSAANGFDYGMDHAELAENDSAFSRDAEDRNHGDQFSNRRPLQFQALGRLSRPHSTSAAEQTSLPGWGWTDIVTTSVAAVALAGLLLPGIVRERASARQEACQTQLREAGVGLTSFAINRPDQRFPQLGVDGPEAFAGYHATALAEQGLLPRTTPMWCPSLDIPAGWVGRPVPTKLELQLASPLDLVALQRVAGGHYAYSLGIIERDRYIAPRFAGRANFAILADAPLQSLDGWVMAHEGRGCNILFEDGHVAFMSNWDAGWLGDHPFLNRSGELAHGLDPNDSAMGASHVPPFTRVVLPISK